MTSDELSNVIAGNLQVIDTALNISPGQVYKAATQAQKDVLMDTRIVERVGTLVVQPGIEEYKFSKKAITGATNASPIEITVPDHSFETGDTVNIFGVLGNTAANGRWVITRVDADTFSLDDSDGNGAYASGGYVYHDLMSVFELKYLYYKDSPFGMIEILDTPSIEGEKPEYAQSTGGAVTNDTLKCYQIFEEEGTRLVFLGSPESSIITKMLYIRIPTDGEEITETKDPIIPHTVREAFIARTMYQLLSYFTNNEKAKVRAKDYDKTYKDEIMKADLRNSQRRFKRSVQPRELRWK